MLITAFKRSGCNRKESGKTENLFKMYLCTRQFLCVGVFVCACASAGVWVCVCVCVCVRKVMLSKDRLQCEDLHAEKEVGRCGAQT